MINAYNFDSELIVYAKKDRLDGITKIIDKLGVSGTTDGSISLRSLSALMIVDNVTRSLRRLKETDSDTVFFKYLIVTKKDGSSCLLFNSKVFRYSDKVTVEFEGMLNFQDVIEAFRMVECSIIDIELESYLKEQYTLNR